MKTVRYLLLFASLIFVASNQAQNIDRTAANRREYDLKRYHALKERNIEFIKNESEKSHKEFTDQELTNALTWANLRQIILSNHRAEIPQYSKNLIEHKAKEREKLIQKKQALPAPAPAPQPVRKIMPKLTAASLHATSQPSSEPPLKKFKHTGHPRPEELSDEEFSSDFE